MVRAPAVVVVAQAPGATVVALAPLVALALVVPLVAQTTQTPEAPEAAASVVLAVLAEAPPAAAVNLALETQVEQQQTQAEYGQHKQQHTAGHCNTGTDRN